MQLIVITDKDTPDGKDTSDAGETNTPFHEDSSTFHFCKFPFHLILQIES